MASATARSHVWPGITRLYRSYKNIFCYRFEVKVICSHYYFSHVVIFIVLTFIIVLMTVVLGNVIACLVEFIITGVKSSKESRSSARIC